MKNLQPIHFFLSSNEEYKIAEKMVDLLTQRLTLAAKKIVQVKAICHSASEKPSELIPNDCIILHSLLHHVINNNKSLDQIESDWSDLYKKRKADFNRATYFLTIFQYCDNSDYRNPLCGIEEKIQRIRELNLLAIKLSHLHQFKIIDLDSIFTKLGAIKTSTDYTLRGDTAQAIAADLISSTLLERHFSNFEVLGNDSKEEFIAGGYQEFFARAVQLVVNFNKP
jgi:hypothetical protein